MFYLSSLVFIGPIIGSETLNGKNAVISPDVPVFFFSMFHSYLETFKTFPIYFFPHLIFVKTLTSCRPVFALPQGPVASRATLHLQKYQWRHGHYICVYRGRRSFRYRGASLCCPRPLASGTIYQTRTNKHNVGAWINFVFNTVSVTLFSSPCVDIVD